MCELLKSVGDGIELEKCGEIYAAPTQNVFVLSCLRCQNPFMQVQDFLWHIQSAHAATTAVEPMTECEIAPAQGIVDSTPAAVLAEHSVIAAKRVTLSDIDDMAITADVVDLTAEIINDVDITPLKSVNDMSELLDDAPEVHEVTPAALPEVMSPVSLDSDESWLPESVTALNEVTEKTVHNNRSSTQTTVNNNFTVAINGEAKQINATLSSKIKSVKLIPPHLPPTPLKVRSLTNIKKLLRERFKQQRTYKKVDAAYSCTYCNKAYITRKTLSLHLQRFHS